MVWQLYPLNPKVADKILRNFANLKAKKNKFILANAMLAS